MTKHHHSLTRLLGVGLLTISMVAQALPVHNAAAAPNQITNRSLTLQAGATGDGGSLPGGTVNHLFEFDISTHSTATSNGLAAIKFEYCTTAAAVAGGIDCTAPTGLDVSNAKLGTEVGAAGFSLLSTSENVVVLSRAVADASGSVSYRLDDIVNPSNTNETFFVRVSTYNNQNATGEAIDDGTVAAATASAIELEGTMPESLVFCTGATIALNAGDVPDCSTATSGAISFDKLFSPTETAAATSQMAASTNAGQGYAITVNGPTLTSGSNTIAPMNTAGDSIQGTPQFGLNLVENIATAGATVENPLGANITETGGALYTGAPSTDYSTPDDFKYLDSEAVAQSSGGSDAQIYTVSYIANVPGSQPAGTYTTTLTYICTPTF